jgi:hypothetical protein
LKKVASAAISPPQKAGETEEHRRMSTKFERNRTVTPQPRNERKSREGTELGTPRGGNNPTDSPRRLSFGSLSVDDNEKIRKGSFDGQAGSPKHSSATATMLFTFSSSPLLAKHHRVLLDGDDVKFMVGESQELRSESQSVT